MGGDRMTTTQAPKSSKPLETTSETAPETPVSAGALKRGSKRRAHQRGVANSPAITGAQTDASDPIDERTRSPAPLDALNMREVAAALLPALAELPRAPQQARSREKRADLLKTAETLFVERGYAATTADEVALAAGVSVGTFYNYFRNKRQILLALVLERLDDIFTHLRVARMDLAHDDQHEVIHGAITAVIDGSQRTGLRRVWQELMSLEPELIPYQQVIRRYALDQLEERLRLSAEAGKTWPDLDIEGTALAIFTLLDALNTRRDEVISDERIVASVTALIERTLFPPSSRALSPTDCDKANAQSGAASGEASA